MNSTQSKFSPNDLPSSLKQWEFQTGTKSQQDFNSRLYRKYSFESFEGGMDFMQQASRRYISAQNHHPCWQNTYTTLEIWLTTHDAKNCVTEKDIQLAECFEKLWLEEYCTE